MTRVTWVNAYLSGIGHFRNKDPPTNAMGNYILKCSFEGKIEMLILHDRYIELSWGDASSSSDQANSINISSIPSTARIKSS